MFLLQNKQKDTISLFRKNEYNLLISTSVAEEGLDIPECNMVVRYGLLTNEIAQQQARGRARAENSVYSVVATRESREVRRELTNEYLEELTSKAVAEVQRMEKDENQDYRKKVSPPVSQSDLEGALPKRSSARPGSGMFVCNIYSNM